MNYRPEIDGLRALAVLPVIAFHAGAPAFAGGFIGVDVFFVISGYLITSILLEDLRTGRFSLAHFYERRARRILPALFVVVAACIPLAWVWLLPGDMADFSASVAAVALFVSNFLFWAQSGYFETAAEYRPLLHTWSLAVEEQFYVLFPLLLLAAWRLARGYMGWLLAGLVVAGLALSQWSVRHGAEAAFFLIHARAWELLVGALIAWYMHVFGTPRGDARLASVAGFAGLALIVWSVFALDARTPFPGINALAPVLGTALVVIFAREGSLVASVLGCRALVGVGLISYSAYLWHQPLFAFARHRSLGEPEAWLMGLLSAASLVLAWASWRLIETPFRRRDRIGRATVVRLALIGSLFFVLFGVIGQLTGGSFWRTHTVAELQRLEARIDTNFGLQRGCSGRDGHDSGFRSSDAPDLMLWGDSFAMHLAQGLLASWPGRGLAQFTSSECAPILGQAPIDRGSAEDEARDCMAHNAGALGWLADSGVRHVVLSASFARHIGAEPVLLEDGRVVPGEDGAFERFVATLERIRASGAEPVVFSHPPADGRDIGRCLVAATLANDSTSVCDVAADDDVSRNAAANAFLVRVAEHARVVWLHQGVCADEVCRAAIDDTFIYRDGAHLSSEGSELLGRRMDFGARILGQPSP